MAGKFGKYLGAAMTAPGKTLNKVADVTASATVGTAKLAKPVVSKVAPLTRKTDPGFHNLWTGRREGAGAIIAASAIAGTYGYVQSEKATRFAPKLGEVSYGGVAPIMNADGVSSANQAPSGGAAPTLGASGNMVFGLHNARKG